MLKILRGLFTFILFIVVFGSIRLATNNPFSKRSTEKIDVYVYSDVLDLHMVDEFTKETGVKVNLHFYAGDEEILTKIKLSNEKTFDLVITSDYMCKILIDQEYVDELDKEKLEFTDRIYPFLLDKEFDKGNVYTLPYIWDVYGFAYNAKTTQKEDLFLADLFNPNYRVVTTPDITEMINIGAWCLFGRSSPLTAKESKHLIAFLQQHKENIEAYADFRARDIISSMSCDLALLKTSYIDSLMERSDAITYALPKDHFFVSIESVAINKHSKNKDTVYEFLNYVYTAKNLSKTVEQFPCYPACADAFNYSTDHHKQYLDTINRVEERQHDALFFKKITSENTTRKIVVETKA